MPTTTTDQNSIDLKVISPEENTDPKEEGKETKKTAKSSAKDKAAALKPERYYEAVGRRKTATARVRLYTKGQGITVNGQDYEKYFPTDLLQKIADASLRKMKSLERFRLSAKTSGGGLKAQAEAIRHGTARVLITFNPDFAKRLKRAGYLTRDPRMKERKKPGLKRARKGPRWAKR